MPNAQSLMITLDLAMLGYTGWLLRLANVPPAVRNWTTMALGLLLVVLIFLFSPGGAMPQTLRGASFFALVLAHVGAVGAVLLGVRPLREAMLALPAVYYLLPQGVRVFFGAAFLLQAATGDLPKTFGILDGFTHVGAGFLGLFAAALLALNPRRRGAVWLAHLFGLADILVVATTLAFVVLAQITPRHPMMFAVFLPAPIWLWFHLLGLRNLTQSSAQPSLAGGMGQ